MADSLTRIGSRVRSLWRGIRRRSAVEAEMNEEFRLHVELRAADLVRGGLSQSEALMQARREFGSPERHKEEARAARGLKRFDELRFSWLDFKLGLRMLGRYPGLTVVGGLAMAFAIAVGAAAFEAMRQLTHPRLPFPDGDRLVSVYTHDLAANRGHSRVAHDFVDWRSDLESVQELGAYRTFERNLFFNRTAAPIQVTEISASAFRIAQVAPLLGRVLTEADERTGASSVIVIGHDVWQSRFRGDRAIIGRTVRLGTAPVTVVGVMPRGFGFPVQHYVWAPLRLDVLKYPRGEGPALAIFGRLAPRISLEAAQAELDALSQRAAKNFPASNEHLRAQLRPYGEFDLPFSCGAGWISCLARTLVSSYSINFYFALFVALVCANVALLMFARAAARESEIVVRSALGASRGRIIAQLVAEALVLGGVAIVLGLLTAGLVLKAAVSTLGFEGDAIPFWWRTSLSLPSALYAIVLTVLGALIAGVLPALKVTRGLGARLRKAAAGAGELRFGGVWTVVIATQVTLTVLLMASAVYVTTYIAGMARFEPGIAAQEFLAVRLKMDSVIPGSVYRGLERRLLSETGVTGLTFASALPGSYHGRVALEIEGVTAPPVVQSTSVKADFLDVIGAPIIAGRAFNASDVEAGRKVVVVNEWFVKQVLGERNALGRRIRFGATDWWDSDKGDWHEIVGVVGQIRMGLDHEMTRAGFYVPSTLSQSSAYMAVHVRDPNAFAARLRSLIGDVEPNLRVEMAQPLDEIKNAEVRYVALWVRMVATATLLVLSLSLAGIYAIMSFTVSRRTREIGIRVALGADRRRIVAGVLARPLMQVTSGVFLSTGVMVILDGVPTLRSALMILGFASFMLSLCLLGCIVPTWRALHIQPTAALKAER